MSIILKLELINTSRSPPEVIDNFGFIIVRNTSKEELTELLYEIGFDYERETDTFELELTGDDFIKVYTEEVEDEKIKDVDNISDLQDLITKIISIAKNEVEE